jgi:hypothetical protein
MNFLRYFRASVVVLLCCLFVSLTTVSALAGKKKTKDDDTPDNTSKVVQSVNPADSTIVIVYMGDNKSTHTYKIDGSTTLMVNGAKAKFTDIKTGMVVTDYMERDAQDLDSLTLTGQ